MLLTLVNLPKGISRFTYAPVRVSFYKIIRAGNRYEQEIRCSPGDPLQLQIGDGVVLESDYVPREFQILMKNKLAKITSGKQVVEVGISAE